MCVCSYVYVCVRENDSVESPEGEGILRVYERRGVPLAALTWCWGPSSLTERDSMEAATHIGMVRLTCTCVDGCAGVLLYVAFVCVA